MTRPAINSHWRRLSAGSVKHEFDRCRSAGDRFDMQTRPTVAIAPLRHACHGCGVCCHGTRPGLTGPDEIARITNLGATLGVTDPVVEGAPRFESGTCVFLTHDQLCMLHRDFGADAKPTRCREFPVQRVQTETQFRVGVDPSCSTSWRTWRTGPHVSSSGLYPVIRSMHPGDAAMEAQLLRMLTGTVAEGLSLLSGRPNPGATRLPIEFDRRLIERVKTIRLQQFLDHSEIGSGLAAPLAHLPDFIDTLDPDNPPSWPVLEPEMDGFAVDLTRRMVFLRYAPLRPAALGMTLLCLAGAVVCAWANPKNDVFGPALSGWSRIIRFQAMWLRMVPDPGTLKWLATGAGAPKV